VSAGGGRVARRGAGGAIALIGLVVVLAAACTGTVSREADADRTLQVGSCFVVDTGGRAVPASCDARNDGVVSAEVEDPQMCELLSAGAVGAFAVVDGRSFCFRDARP